MFLSYFFPHIIVGYIWVKDLVRENENEKLDSHQILNPNTDLWLPDFL